MLGIKITNTTPAFNLIACYRTPGKNLSQEQWKEIFSISIMDISDYSIVVGDFNAHHRVWNCFGNDTNGEKLYNIMQTEDIYLHNPHSYTHIDFYRKKNQI